MAGGVVQKDKENKTKLVNFICPLFRSLNGAYFYFFHQASCRKDQFTVSILNLVLKVLLIQVY